MSYIDTRDLIAELTAFEDRIAQAKELRDEHEERAAAFLEAGGRGVEAAEEIDALVREAEETDLDDEERERMGNIRELRDTIGDEFEHGVTLIPDDMFKAYAQELAEDIYGKELRAATWPFSCIDWEHAADELRYDYSAVDFDGTTYLYQS